MTEQKQAHVAPAKKRIVTELVELIKNKKTVLIASIKNLPASQFQEIGKKLRGKAIVKVPKKNLIYRAIEDSGNEEIKKLEEQIQDSVAVLFSDLESYDLATELVNNKSPAKAKPDQEAPEDIEVKAGMTELIPGPAISELGAVGLKVKVTNGKLEIMGDKIIVKEGEKISQAAADVMSKLDIKPFSVGYIPLSAFDTSEGKLYLDIKIDKEEAVEDLKIAFGKALPFAVEIGYFCSDTIKLLIGKAGAEEKTLERFVGRDASGVGREEGKSEEVKETEVKSDEKTEEIKKENKSEEKVEEEEK